MGGSSPTAQFIWEVAKRLYWLLPTLLTDPFDLVERVFHVSYEVPIAATWALIGAGFLLATLFAYHDVRMSRDRYADHLERLRAENLPLWVVMAQQEALDSLARFRGIAHQLVTAEVTETTFGEWVKAARVWQERTVQHVRANLREMDAQRLISVTTTTKRVWAHAISDEHDRVCQELHAQATILEELDQQYG